jgi:hypothetical protein
MSDILNSRINDISNPYILILVICIGAAIFCALYDLFLKLIDLFVEGLKVIFGKIEKPKFKALHRPKRKQDNYPVDVYLNNTMRYLLEYPDYNVRAISELRYAMIRGHYVIQPDVMLKLSVTFPNWHFPEEDE